MKTSTDSNGQIEECVAFTDCNNDVVISNHIHTNLTVAKYPFATLTGGAVPFYDINLLFNSCHACATATNVVVSFIH